MRDFLDFSVGEKLLAEIQEEHHYDASGASDPPSDEEFMEYVESLEAAVKVWGSFASEGSTDE